MKIHGLCLVNANIVNVKTYQLNGQLPDNPSCKMQVPVSLPAFAWGKKKEFILFILGVRGVH